MGLEIPVFNRDPASIRTMASSPLHLLQLGPRRLFETWRLLEHGPQNPGVYLGPGI